MNGNELLVETERLVMRPYREDDYGAWRAGLEGRTLSQHPYDEGRPADLGAYTQDWFNEWIRGFRHAADQDRMLILGIFRKTDGANIGKIEIITILRMDYNWAMMGYQINNQFFRLGYGKEAVTTAAGSFFDELGFHRIELHIRPDNHPSKKLAESAGFRFECTRPQFAYEDGKWRDYDIFTKYESNRAVPS
ncbi:GNAT family N-acetyltransferase [Edaphobacillus lindanitolerans]|uniref:Protein N-acetyltransferase, RimJ/RimL family n=1 Tax=Edaphobacillus lindanitolerans TaxID=550447 RepID=A0A1U7PL56_9BACI|nr:GNAT family protein [Edaphobacillus lindanitolerans]SIT87257.1 Protein N-acetyltransferase, RimJ/RimL family [Edaphobacillus lindanitolerans]